MAQKRMFDKRVVESDKFTDLPNSSKALYFMAGMSADDKGFFQPRRLQKMCGFSDDDFKILIAKRFFIAFESGVMVVTDWNKNNWLDTRRITETEYVEELKLLDLVNEKYEFKDTCLANAKPMLSQNRIEENSIEENSIDIYVQNPEENFERLWKMYPNKKGKENAKKSYLKAISENITNEEIERGIINYINYIKFEDIKPRFIKNGSTWFHQRCWQDDYTIKRDINTNDIAKVVDVSAVFREV